MNEKNTAALVVDAWYNICYIWGRLLIVWDFDTSYVTTWNWLYWPWD